MEIRKDTRRLRTYIESDGHDDMDVFISCNRYLTNDNKDTAYPMLNKIPVIGTHDEYHLSGAGIAAQKLYDNKRSRSNRQWEYGNTTMRPPVDVSLDRRHLI